jgi:hypothetical protein
MERDISIPVVWSEDDGSPLAGRLDVGDQGLHLDGGARESRRTRDIPFTEIASFSVDRAAGRRGVVLELVRGGSISFVPFDRPGALHELVDRLQLRVSPGLA